MFKMVSCAKIIMGKKQLYMNLTAVLKAQPAVPFAIVQKTWVQDHTHKFLCAQKPAGTGGGIRKMTALLQRQTEINL